MSSLKAKSFQGILWSLIDNLSGSGISFIIGIVLARLLSPAVFGLIGMVTIFFAIATTFIDSGFSTGLIRKITCSQVEFDTVFLFNLSVSCFIYGIFFFMAPYIAIFYKEPQLIRLIRILSLLIVIDSISIVQRVILIRAINFKQQTKISLISSVISGVIGIGMAYRGYGVWSLVFQMLTKQVLNGLLLWYFSKWLPTFSFSKTAFKEMFKFGSKLLGSGLIVTLQNNIYYFVIGKYYSAISLGFYTRADQFNAIVTNNLTGTLERVFLPVLASIQQEEQRLKDTLKKMLRTSFFITFFALMMLAILAKPLIYLLIGEKWSQSVPYLQLLCLSSVFFPFNVVNLNILKVKGRSDLILRLQIIKTSLTLLIIASGVFWGISVMLSVRIFTTLIATVLNSQYSGNLVGYSAKKQMIDISPYFFSISFILIGMIFISFLPLTLYVIALLQITVGILLFFLIFERKKHVEYLEIKAMVANGLNSKLPNRLKIKA